MSAEQNRTTLATCFEATARGDGESVVQYFDPSITLHEPESLPYGGVYKGLEEVGPAVAEVGKHIDMSTLRVDRIVADDQTGIVFMNAKWRVPEGGTRDIQCCEVYQFSPEGKITEIRVYYWDTAVLT
jgi:ketosteroid isomerase-like protein